MNMSGHNSAGANNPFMGPESRRPGSLGKFFAEFDSPGKLRGLSEGGGAGFIEMSFFRKRRTARLAAIRDIPPLDRPFILQVQNTYSWEMYAHPQCHGEILCQKCQMKMH
jgi:hypothetical protein